MDYKIESERLDILLEYCPFGESKVKDTHQLRFVEGESYE